MGDFLLTHNEGLRDLGTFFRSNMIETGMFSMAATEPVVFNALQQLMSPGAGDFEAAPLSSYLETTFAGGPLQLSFWEVHDLVRRKGDLLVGWQRSARNCLWSSGSLAQSVHKFPSGAR